ncbi:MULTISPECIES: glycosyltransferase family 2 protein [Rahnella]|uniref:glycosyltransferase family 2 protein n=1 Tax=Rahnella TaxID=34037 RepID=UPI003D278B63
MIEEYKKLTVIVPVYNEEKNIYKLLNNLNQQSIKDFEVIVVDDGSTDKTVEILEAYISDSFRLRLIKQCNMGAAKARENAIKDAKGDYVALVDCDDLLASDSLEKTMSFLIKNNLNISLFNLHYVNNGNLTSDQVFQYYTNKDIISGYEAFANCISYWGVHAFGIYEKKIFIKAYDEYNSLNQESVNYLNNDEVISRICFSLSQRVGMSNGNYYFINNPESTTRRVNKNYYRVIHNAFYLLQYIKTCDERTNNDLIVHETYKLIVSTVWGVFVRFKKWKKELDASERSMWQDLIKNSAKNILSLEKKNHFRLTVKSRLQLLLIRYFS